MKLELNNIGVFNNASVEIDGITVLAGENASGKSTVGKALYAIFHGLKSYKEKIKGRKVFNILNLLTRIPVNTSKEAEKLYDSELIQDFANKVLSKKEEYLKDETLLKNDILTYLELDVESPANLEFITDTADRIIESLKLSDTTILNSVINISFNGEFNSEIINKYNGGNGSVSLIIKSDTVKVNINNDKVESIDNPIELVKDIVYIDDPYVLDDLNGKSGLNIIIGNKYGSHRDDLYEKLKLKNEDTIEEIKINEKLNSILEKLESVNLGKLQKVGTIYTYSDPITKLELDVRNIATGLKAFVILKTLLENGSLEEKGTIILDEPEIHLHPKWQLVLAELIVLIHKVFNMHILLNTHSPYFLRAIEVFSMKYNVDDKTKYYLVTRNKADSKIDDVTDDTSKIYKLLADPLDKLDEVLNDEA